VWDLLVVSLLQFVVNTDTDAGDPIAWVFSINTAGCYDISVRLLLIDG
jgi:hypothetical protein